MTDKIDTRDLILNAAMDRIVHYGYAKTTMSEIARDCDMSAGNIYRFFASKIDIAEAIARRYLAKVNQDLAAIVRDDSLSARRRLRTIYRYELDRLHEFLQKDPNILEVANIVGSERPDYPEEAKSQEQLHLKTVLKSGQANGELRTDLDLDKVATSIQCSMIKFCYPEFVVKFDIDDLHREQDGVFDLIFTGIEADGAPPET